MMRALVVLALLAAPAHADGVFVGMHHGFVHFDGTRVKQLFKTPRFVDAIAQSAPDVLWLASTLSVHRYNQGKLDEKAFYVAQYVRATASGVVWFGNQKEVSWFDGTWHTLALPNASVGMRDLEIDDQGRVWIVAGDRLYYTKGAGWTTFVGPTSDGVKYCKIASRGDLYLACWKEVYRLSQNTWTSAGTIEQDSIEDLYVAPDHTIYVVGGKRMHVRPPSGDPLVFELPNWNQSGFVVDGRGRMWFTHGNGLTVFDAKGKKLKLPRALAKRDQMHSIFVEGDGPDF